jgi:hypothetical protein
MSSRITSKRGSRSGSMDDGENHDKEEAKSIHFIQPKTIGGKIINKLEKGEE